MNIEELHKEIERYFEGESSVAEERALRRALLEMRPGDDPLADEALAVMGFGALSGVSAPKTRQRKGWWRVASAAAVVAGLALFLSLTFRLASSDSQECFAYVGGERIENEEFVRNLMMEQLNDIQEARTDVDDQINTDFEDFRTAFEQIDEDDNHENN